ncbi:MAG TPA: chorismate mutase [Thermoanaerobaculia bacterium]|jgi:chorismate mutase|nr:chorismate mutase [Thermoanaerobaculia bacterium]
MSHHDAEAELIRLREAIDRVDEVLVKLLNQRAKYAVEIGEIKGQLALPIYAPEREKEVLHHVEQTSAGPLQDAAIRRLFERIIDESRRVERESAHIPANRQPPTANRGNE